MEGGPNARPMWPYFFVPEPATVSAIPPAISTTYEMSYCAQYSEGN